MKIGFRTDASVQIGSGHVYRCLALADALVIHGASCVFLCRSHDGNLMKLIAERGHSVIDLGEPQEDNQGETRWQDNWLGTNWETDARQTQASLASTKLDWLIVDHYALDAQWEGLLRSATERIMVIDDLADRPHHCDLILDQNFGRLLEDYNSLIPAGTTILLGPKYALLRPDFAAMRAESLARRAKPELRNILVTMGGVDKNNVTARVLEYLDSSALPDYLKITVVVGSNSPWLSMLRDRATKMRLFTKVLVDVKEMAWVMAYSDLAIGAGGSTTWERCTLGLPSIQTVIAANQLDITLAVARVGAAYFSEIESLSATIESVFNLDDLPSRLAEMSNNAAAITDGNGADKVARYLMEHDQ